MSDGRSIHLRRRTPRVHAAPFWRRALADLIDLALLLGVGVGLWAADVLGPDALPPRRYDWIDYGAELVADHAGLFRPPLVFLLTLGLMYAVGSRALLGRTLGEAALGLRLIARDATPAGPLRSLAHALGTVLGLLPLTLGYLWAAVDLDRQGFAEYLSGSVLIVGEPER